MENRVCCSAGRSLRSPAAFWIANSSSATDSNDDYEYAPPGGIVKRNFLILGTAALAVAGAVFAQDPPPAKTKKSASSGGGSAARGKEVFEKKCAICHYADNDQKKIGPGLKGISKRGTFTVNNNKVTDETLRTWIENGDTLMPPFKDVLDAGEIKDVIAYVKTL
jgi:cytochrome c